MGKCKRRLKSEEFEQKQFRDTKSLLKLASLRALLTENTNILYISLNFQVYLKSKHENYFVSLLCFVKSPRILRDKVSQIDSQS